MLLLKLSDTQGGMFDEASEADMGLHFAKVGEELFDAAAPAAATRGRLPTEPEDPPVSFGVAPSRRVGQASEDRRSAQGWHTCRRLHR
jgi:hypothetical protein